MAGFLKAVLIATLSVTSLVIFFNAAFFFPWYLTLVEKGFELSQIIATNNFLPASEYWDALEDLQERPIFNKRPDNIVIEAQHVDSNRENYRSAIENSRNSRDIVEYYNLPEDSTERPYVQMGNSIRITIKASYPFEMRLFQNTLDLSDIDISFSMMTTTTRHYKDLEYIYVEDPYDPNISIDDNFFDWEAY